MRAYDGSLIIKSNSNFTVTDVKNFWKLIFRVIFEVNNMTTSSWAPGKMLKLISRKVCNSKSLHTEFTILKWQWNWLFSRVKSQNLHYSIIT